MAFEDLKNKLREAAALFDEGGWPAVREGKMPTSVTVEVRQSAAAAGDALARAYPNTDLLTIIDTHRAELGKKIYNREALKFWRAVWHYCYCLQLGTTRDGKRIEFKIIDDAGRGWPPFEKPCMTMTGPINAAPQPAALLPPRPTALPAQKSTPTLPPPRGRTP